MIFLLIASLIWAFSFGLLKGHLVNLDPSFVAWARLLVAVPVFLPFLRMRHLNFKLSLWLMFIGAIQYGLLYTSYTISFQYLEAYQVALFTILTPIYVTLIDDIYKKDFDKLNMAMAILAVLGAVIIKYKGLELRDLLTGFMLVQVSNICFAFGQIEYRRLRRVHAEFKDREVYAMLFIGAVLFTSAVGMYTNAWKGFSQVTTEQVYILLYLGTLATGVGFFLWNVGATKTHAGTLAVFNNLKIPLAVFVSLVFFGERTDLVRLIIGGGIMVAAVVIVEKVRQKRIKKPA